MKEIKVCHLTSAHKAKDDRIFVKECISLAKAGYEVYIIAPDAENRVCDNVHFLGINSFKIKSSRVRRFVKVGRLVYQKAVELDADIYHLHDPELLLYGLKLKHRGKKVIFDSHEDVPNQILSKTWIPGLLRSFVARIYEIIEKRCITKFDGVITVNDIIANRLKKINSNVAIVTNYPVLEESRRLKDSCTSKERSICFAGNIKPDYMHHLILDVIDEIDDVKYYLAGSVSETYLDNLKHTPGWDKVVFKGFLNRKDLFELYSVSMIGVALHNYAPNVGGREGSLGIIKNFEIMMAGLPIVCTDFRVWKHIVQEEQCGICVNPTNKEEIKEAITYLLNNPQIAFQMGKNGREAVKKKYNWGLQEPILFNFYERLV